jgi:hypothetical protein
MMSCKKCLRSSLPWVSLSRIRTNKVHVKVKELWQVHNSAQKLGLCWAALGTCILYSSVDDVVYFVLGCFEREAHVSMIDANDFLGSFYFHPSKTGTIVQSLLAYRCASAQMGKLLATGFDPARTGVSRGS